MKHASFSQTQVYKNSDQCTAYEYLIKDPNINAAIAVINGRYPDKGYAINQKCKEMVYVIKGTGKLVVKDKAVQPLKAKDVVLIQPGEPYYWQGNLDIFMPCTPAWYPEQHKIIEE